MPVINLYTIGTTSYAASKQQVRSSKGMIAGPNLRYLVMFCTEHVANVLRTSYNHVAWVQFTQPIVLFPSVSTTSALRIKPICFRLVACLLRMRVDKWYT